MEQHLLITIPVNQLLTHFTQNCSGNLTNSGFYVRKSDGKEVKRFRCTRCKKYSSNAQRSPCYKQNKRNLNGIILKLLCSNVSQRRIALILNISRNTVFRKFEFLALQSKLKNIEFLKFFENNKISEIFIDEMEDRIHTKCKPVSIALAVTKNRKIIMHKTSQIRPKNRKLYQLSLKKYPLWINNSRAGFRFFIKQIEPLVENNVMIRSDEKKMYHQEIVKILPQSIHKRYLSRKAVIAGQGEIKAGGRDPLFELNHTCAMLRANINRLIRRTWCTSKKIESLSKHIEIFTYYHNTVLT